MEKESVENFKDSLIDKSALTINANENYKNFTINYENMENVNKANQSNEIRTSKYTYYNFVFKILFEQFSQAANVYFLVLGVLQMIPAISQSGGTPVMLLPLFFVVVVNGMKDFCEDFKRKQSDNRENNTKCHVFDSLKKLKKKKNFSYDDIQLKQVSWKNLKPGHIVKINKDENFPCDLVMIHSSNKNGSAFTETKNLDGETNLKHKECLKNVFLYLKNFNSENLIQNEIKSFSGSIECEDPNPYLYEFKGIFKLNQTIICDESKNNNSILNHRRSFLNEEEYSKEVANIFKNIFKSDEKLRRKTSENFKKKEDDIIITDSDEEKQIKDFLLKRNSVNLIRKKQPYEESSIKQNYVTQIDHNNLLLRGSSLKNTDYIYGIIVFAGHNSKIMMNSLNARTKISRVFKMMNKHLIFIIILQFLISFILTLFHLISEVYNSDNVFLNDCYVADGKYYFFIFFSWLLALSNIVPISLLVTIEMIKFCQAILISWDHKIYDLSNNRCAIVQSSGLNEELGQVKHIFTDKTGTLTKNQMVFRYLFIENKLYGKNDKEKKNEELKDKNYEEEKDKKFFNVNFRDENFFDELNNQNSETFEKIKNFIFNMAICHSVIPEINETKKEITYNSSSPDESALVNGAKYLGAEFADRTEENIVKVKFKGEFYQYKLLHLFEFNSDRKRMSVIVKDQNNKIKLITKGADLVIFTRIAKNEENLKKKKNFEKQLEKFGNQGLRTLVYAERILSETDLINIEKSYLSALIDLKNKNRKLNELYEEYESDLIILGITAIEDCLQDHLKPTLQSFRELGIKIWMLTGDNPFTAVNIAHSCGLIDKTQKSFVVSEPNPQNIRDQFDKIKVYIDKNNLKNLAIESSTYNRINDFCLIITGDCLTIIQKDDKRSKSTVTNFSRTSQKENIADNPFKSDEQFENERKKSKLSNIDKKSKDKNLLELFQEISSQTDTVICSRVSPKQKADLIILVKNMEKENITTLAIGDGANDVNMITAADIGIGIMGNEGQQAARASDYVIGQFSFLKRLLFVHGREAQRKNAFAIGYILWKNFLYVIPIIIFGFFSQFSSQLIYDPFIDILYNILFTAYPIGWFATYDKERNYDELENNPKFYQKGLENGYFNIYVFWNWYFYGLVAGILIFWHISFVFIKNDLEELWTIGHSVLLCIIFVVNFKLLIKTKTHNCLSVILFIASNSSYVLVIFFTDKLISMNTFGFFQIVFKNFTFYLLVILIISSCMMGEYAWENSLILLRSLFQITKKALTDIKIRKKNEQLKINMKKDFEENRKRERESKHILEHNMSKDYKIDFFSNSINNINPLNKKLVNEGLEDEEFNKNKKDYSNKNIIIEEKIIDERFRTSEEQQILESNKYTGFCLPEDKPDVEIINHLLIENFVDERLKNINTEDYMNLTGERLEM